MLVLRGTKLLNEIAADLTCDLEEFETAISPDGDFHLRYYVHDRMLLPAQAKGDPSGKPVRLAMREALHLNPGRYVFLFGFRSMTFFSREVFRGEELVLCGHCLGVGMVAILWMMWDDLRTCLAVDGAYRRVGGCRCIPLRPPSASSSCKPPQSTCLFPLAFPSSSSRRSRYPTLASMASWTNGRCGPNGRRGTRLRLRKRKNQSS